jgi:glycosyltransferase involved in cell wall biosynthesis
LSKVNLSKVLPAVTIILPTFNRAAFLRQAFTSITSQTFTNWHLVIVDDGSTDATRQLADAFAAECRRPVTYVYQENHGAYSARNRGLEYADTSYVAFFDSDDIWMPTYLERCITALERVEEIDWIYAPCRMVDTASGKLIKENTFFANGRPKPFLGLRTRAIDDVQVIVDPAAMECHLLHGLAAGLQNSVMRRSIIGSRRFNERSRVIDDQHFVVRVLAAGGRFGYVTDPLVVYNVHDDNSSGSATSYSPEKWEQIARETVLGLEDLRSQLSLTRGQRQALNKRLSEEYFWQLGYNSLWRSGRRREALEAFGQSLSLRPWGVWRWKTFILAWVRTHLASSRNSARNSLGTGGSA